MDGSVFSKAKFMIGVGFEILSFETPVPQLPPRYPSPTPLRPPPPPPHPTRECCSSLTVFLAGRVVSKRKQFCCCCFFFSVFLSFFFFFLFFFFFACLFGVHTTSTSVQIGQRLQLARYVESKCEQQDRASLDLCCSTCTFPFIVSIQSEIRT